MLKWALSLFPLRISCCLLGPYYCTSFPFASVLLLLLACSAVPQPAWDIMSKTCSLPIWSTSRCWKKRVNARYYEELWIAELKTQLDPALLKIPIYNLDHLKSYAQNLYQKEMRDNLYTSFILEKKLLSLWLLSQKYSMRNSVIVWSTRYLM